jgi:hypothetical protein
VQYIFATVFLKPSTKLYQYSQVTIGRVQPEALPDPAFIMSNLPTARPVPPTTATKKGRGAGGKRKASASAKEKAKDAKKPVKKT